MDRRHRGRHGRVTAKGTRPAGRRPTGPPEPEEEPDLLGDVRAMVASDHPHELLTAGSHLVGLMAERPPGRVGRGEPRPASEPGMVETLIDADLPETTALLCAMAPLLTDELQARRVRRALARRSHALPEWVWSLDRVEMTGAWCMAHVLGDAEQVMIGARWPTGHEATAVVHVDHNLGTVAKNGFLVPEAIGWLVERFQETTAEGGDTVIGPLEPAEARARIFEAIANAQVSAPPFETDTWPASRSAVEWLTAQLPAGGTGYERPEWTDEARADLVDAFLASEDGAPLAGDPDAVLLLDSVVWFGCDYGPGDPLRWSPVVCEVLLDGFLHKSDAPPALLAGLPAVLRRFVAYAHRGRGIAAALTAETLAAVDAYAGDYREAARFDRPWSPEIVLSLAGLQWRDAGDPEAGRDLLGEQVREALTEAVGGADALASLGAVALPDEPFDWAGVPEDIRPRVEIILGLVDQCCDERLDTEYRTVCRRLLGRAARGPEVFRRQARDVPAAAAVVWLAGKANGLFTTYGGDMLVKDLLAWFGIMHGSVAQRASSLRRAAGLPGDHRSASDIRLGDPGLLTARRRSELIEIRDRFAAP